MTEGVVVARYFGRQAELERGVVLEVSIRAVWFVDIVSMSPR